MWWYMDMATPTYVSIKFISNYLAKGEWYIV